MTDKGLPTCPHCKKRMRVVKGKYGHFFGCVNYPKCKFTSKARWFANNVHQEDPEEFRDKGVVHGSYESNFK